MQIRTGKRTKKVNCGKGFAQPPEERRARAGQSSYLLRILQDENGGGLSDIGEMALKVLEYGRKFAACGFSNWGDLTVGDTHEEYS